MDRPIPHERLTGSPVPWLRGTTGGTQGHTLARVARGDYTQAELDDL